MIALRKEIRCMYAQQRLVTSFVSVRKRECVCLCACMKMCIHVHELPEFNNTAKMDKNKIRSRKKGK